MMKSFLLPPPTLSKKPSSELFPFSKRLLLSLMLLVFLAVHLSTHVLTLPRRISDLATLAPFASVRSLSDTLFAWHGTRAAATASLPSWVHHLRAHSPSGNLTTARLGCREYDAGAQSCVYEGLMCFNTSARREFGRPMVYFVDEGEQDGTDVPSDSWCAYRSQSADPRYFSSRHWPLMNGTLAPQRSCLRATFRSLSGMLDDAGVRDIERDEGRVNWVNDLALVDLDYVNNNHNNHFVKDVIWMLDVALWQKSVDARAPPDGAATLPDQALFDMRGPQRVYLPQGEEDFNKQTSRDVNRLMYALILQMDPKRLYPIATQEELQEESEVTKTTAPLLEAFPELKQRLMFHREMVEREEAELVCTSRLTVGAKIGNGGHERVCRHLRQESYKLYGVKEPAVARVGQVRFPQPPKRVVILQRHVTRKIDNLEELESRLRAELEAKGVEVEVVTTEKMKTAEQHMRLFSRAGVLITPHGSHSMGQIWMPRHSALIEIMPVGYTDYAFSLLADSCKIWYYELQSMMPPNKTVEYYEKECGKKTMQVLDPCTTVKSTGVMVDVAQAVRTTRFALGRLGYPTGDLEDASYGAE